MSTKVLPNTDPAVNYSALFSYDPFSMGDHLLAFVAVNKSDVIRNLLSTVHDMKIKEMVSGGMP